MRDYGRVRTQFWESDSIRDLAPDVKFLALYLLTSPHSNAIGCFRLPIAYVEHDTGMEPQALADAMAELRRAGFRETCERSPWIWLPNYLKHNPPENPNVWRKCAKEVMGLPAELLSARRRIALELCEIANEDRMRKLDAAEVERVQRFANGIETVPNGLPPCPIPSPKPEPVPEPPSLRSGVVPAPETPPAQSPVSRNDEAEAIPPNLDRTDERQALNAYNLLASEMDWPQAQKLTDPRRRAIRARLKDCGGLAGWHGAMAKARASPFLRGETQRTKGHENWVPDIDFFIQESTFTKLMEGKYDGRAGNAEPTGFAAVVEGARRASAGGGRAN